MFDFFNQIPVMILALPAILFSLSFHEAAHAYAAYKLGDPTARNLGRLTLNPIKHINIYGFIMMLFFRIGWANPVPINTRNFKDPRKHMAMSAAAGPLSNLCLGVIFTILLRIVLIPLESITKGAYGVYEKQGQLYYLIDPALREDAMFVILSLIATMLFFGIALNFNLMIFNLIPLPPLDGSRIAYVFLPAETYFKIMQYERYIMFAFIFLLASGILTLPIGIFTEGITNFLFNVLGMPEDLLTVVRSDILNRLPTFNL